MQLHTYEEVLAGIQSLTKEEQARIIETMSQSQSAADAEEVTVTVRPVVRRVPVREFKAEMAWLKENREKYRGHHVALKDGQLILSDTDERRFSQRLAQAGIVEPFLSYVETETEEKYTGLTVYS